MSDDRAARIEYRFVVGHKPRTDFDDTSGPHAPVGAHAGRARAGAHPTPPYAQAGVAFDAPAVRLPPRGQPPAPAAWTTGASPPADTDCA